MQNQIIHLTFLLLRERERQPYLAKSKQYGTYLSHSRMKNNVATDKNITLTVSQNMFPF